MQISWSFFLCRFQILFYQFCGNNPISRRIWFKSISNDVMLFSKLLQAKVVTSWWHQQNSILLWHSEMIAFRLGMIWIAFIIDFAQKYCRASGFIIIHKRTCSLIDTCDSEVFVQKNWWMADVVNWRAITQLCSTFQINKMNGCVSLLPCIPRFPIGGRGSREADSAHFSPVRFYWSLPLCRALLGVGSEDVVPLTHPIVNAT